MILRYTFYLLLYPGVVLYLLIVTINQNLRSPHATPPPDSRCSSSGFHTVAALCRLISGADFIVVELVFVTDIDW